MQTMMVLATKNEIFAFIENGLKSEFANWDSDKSGDLTKKEFVDAGMEEFKKSELSKAAK